MLKTIKAQHQPQCGKDRHHLAKLNGRLARFELDYEPRAHACDTGEFLLAQVLRLVGGPDCGAKFIRCGEPFEYNPGRKNNGYMRQRNHHSSRSGIAAPVFGDGSVKIPIGNIIMEMIAPLTSQSSVPLRASAV